MLNTFLKALALIEEYISKISVDDFMKSRQIQDAVMRRLEIIGEATKNIPDSFRKEIP